VALRGGSWANPAQNLAVAIRNRNFARNRNQNIGFRVVLSSFSEHALGAMSPEPCRKDPGQAAKRSSELARLGRSSQPLAGGPPSGRASFP